MNPSNLAFALTSRKRLWRDTCHANRSQNQINDQTKRQRSSRAAPEPEHDTETTGTYKKQIDSREHAAPNERNSRIQSRYFKGS